MAIIEALAVDRGQRANRRLERLRYRRGGVDLFQFGTFGGKVQRVRNTQFEFDSSGASHLDKTAIRQQAGDASLTMVQIRIQPV
jgi:hypothetical protein